MKKSYRHVVLFSGGIDSSTVAYMLQDSPGRTLLFHLNQGYASHERQSRKLANLLKMDMITYDIREMVDILKKPGRGYTPGYRSLAYLLLLAVADRYDAPYVYTGELDTPFSSKNFEKDPEWVRYSKFMNESSYVGGDSTHLNRTKLAMWHGLGAYNDQDRMMFVDPIAGMLKSEVIRLGKRLGVPLHETVSCRRLFAPSNQNTFHCGTCTCCVSRRAGFKLAGVRDITKYESKGKIPEDYLKASI